MEHSNHVGSYTEAHKSLMNLLSDGVMAQLARPSGPEVTTEADEALDAAMASSFYFRRRSAKRCGCAQCKAVRAAM
jgi:hypothetical protein